MRTEAIQGQKYYRNLAFKVGNRREMGMDCEKWSQRKE